MKKFKIKYVLIPIFIIFILIIGMTKNNFFKSKIAENSQDSQIVNEVQKDNSLSAVIPHWEEMTISEQFSEVNYNNYTYTSKNTKIENSKIGEQLGTAILTGYDTYTDTKYNKNGTLYAINELSKNCVIAVQFENENEYYVYVNFFYRPETLEQFMTDLKLKDIVSFGSVWYEHAYDDENGNKQFENVEFTNVNNDVIWQMLFDNTSLTNVYKDGDYHKEVMGISVDIPLLGYENISVSVTEDGYLETNILESGKAFYIGEEKVQRFVDYVLENYDGDKTVHINENSQVNNTNDESDFISIDDVLSNTNINETNELYSK